MSQSDYVRFKKSSVMLRDLANNEKVLDYEKYINYKQYTLENTIVNTKPIYGKLTLPNNNVIFNMEKNVSYCPKTIFNVCVQTNERSNRVLNSPYTFQPSPLTFINQKVIENIT